MVAFFVIGSLSVNLYYSLIPFLSFAFIPVLIKVFNGSISVFR
jgi:hypothetical protein